MEERSAHDELAMIRRLMEDSQRVIYDSGKHYIVWGVLMAAALVGTYATVANGPPVRTGWIWGIAVGVGWLISLWLEWREYPRVRVRTLAGRLLGAIWVGSGIALTLVGLLGSATGALADGSISGVMAIVLGAPYFASGILYEHGWVRWLAVGWWGGGVAMLLWPGLYTVLVMAALLVVLQLVPGMVLYAQARRGLAGEAG